MNEKLPKFNPHFSQSTPAAKSHDDSLHYILGFPGDFHIQHGRDGGQNGTGKAYGKAWKSVLTGTFRQYNGPDASDDGCGSVSADFGRRSADDFQYYQQQRSTKN